MKKFEKFIHPVSLKYFSDKGESMSDAQSMKGKCTQVAEDVKAYFEALGAVRETLHFDGGKDINTVSPKVVDASSISEIVGKDSQANTLNGWYARAIEAKQDLLAAIKNASATSFLEDDEEFAGLDFPEKFEAMQPRLSTFNEADVLAEWSAKDLADFLEKEQYCATIGKLIHKRGKLHEIYNSPLNNTAKITELASGNMSGKKAYPVTVEPVYSGDALKAIKDLYLAQHDKHREYEKSVNFYKAKIKNELTEKNAQAQKEYSEQLQVYNKLQSEFNERRSAFLEKVRNENAVLNAKCEERRQRTVKEASALKIFIPEPLRDIKKFVQEYKSQVS